MQNKAFSKILIIIIFIILISVGVLSYQYILTPEEGTQLSKSEEVKPEEKPIEEQAFNLATTKLSTISEEYDWVNLYSVSFSPDGKMVAYIAGKGEKEFMVVNNKEGKYYDYICPVFFSPDGKKVAYRAIKGISLFGSEEEMSQTWKDAKEFVVINGIESEAYKISSSLPIFKEKKQRTEYNQPCGEPIFFSPDGKQIAYLVKKEGEKILMINEMKEKIYGYGSDIGAPIFSPDNKNIAYFNCEPKKDGLSSCFIVINGKKAESYDWVNDDINPVFSPDSQKIAYVAGKIEKGALKQFLVVNDTNGNTYQLINTLYKDGITYYSPPVFSPDSQKIAYIATDKKGSFVVINDKEGKAYQEVDSIVFSPDSKNIAYIAKKDGKKFVVLNEQEGLLYEDVLSVNFTTENKIIYGVINNKKQIFIIDGKESKGYDWILTGTLSRDGKRIAALIIQEGKEFIVVDGKEEKTYDEVGFPIFSPDSKNYAYRAKEREKELVVINGLEGERHDVVFMPVAAIFDTEMLAYNPSGIKFIAFSPDSKYIYYGAKSGNEFWWIVKRIE